jgi:hypothetical protein
MTKIEKNMFMQKFYKTDEQTFDRRSKIVFCLYDFSAFFLKCLQVQYIWFIAFFNNYFKSNSVKTKHQTCAGASFSIFSAEAKTIYFQLELNVGTDVTHKCYASCYVYVMIKTKRQNVPVRSYLIIRHGPHT